MSQYGKRRISIFEIDQPKCVNTYGDGVAYPIDGADFDGTNDYMDRGAGLTGAADSKLLTLSFWIKPAADATTEYILESIVATVGRSHISRGPSNWIGLSFVDASNNERLGVTTAANSVMAGSWAHVLFSCDLTDTAKRHIYVNDVESLNSYSNYGNFDVDFTCADWRFGARYNGLNKTNSDFADFYFAPGQYIDFSVESNRRKFIDANLRPVDLGADGSTPTGVAPLIFFHLDDGETVSNFATNDGSGGSFSITGALATASTSPTDGMCTAGQVNTGTLQNQYSVSCANTGAAYASVADDATLDSGTGSFTVEYVVSSTTYSGDYRNFVYKGATAGLSGFRAGFISNQLNALMGDASAYSSGYLSSADTLTDYQTHHCAFVFNRATGLVTGYVDGVAGDTPLDISAQSGSIDNANSLFIGNSYLNFEGSFDSLRLYQRALLPSEIEEHARGLYLDETDLVLHVPFNEGTGTTAADVSGNGNDATLTASATWVQDLDAAETAKLASTASSSNDLYNGQTLRLSDGREAVITDYDGPSRVARVADQWPTNYLLQSEDFDTTWTKTNVTVTTDATTAPDGTTTADRIVATGGGNTYVIQTATGIKAGQLSHYRICAKADQTTSGRYVRFEFHNTRYVGGTATFDLIAGVKTAGLTDDTMTPLGNGWWLCEASRYTLIDNPSNAVLIHDTFTPTAGLAIFLWGAQESVTGWEYIKTTTARFVLPSSALTYEVWNQPCYNTRATCQDAANYNSYIDETTRNLLQLRFTFSDEDLHEYGNIIPSIEEWDRAAGTINLGGMNEDESAVGQRETLQVSFTDHKHSDLLVDPYRLDRYAFFDPYQRSTFWSKWLARNPYYSNYRCRLYQGFEGQALGEMDVRHYVIDAIAGPDDGRVTLTAKDAFVLIERQKAVAPVGSLGELDAGISAAATSLTLAPTSIGSDYPPSGSPPTVVLAIGDELVEGTISGDVVSSLTRGAYNTTAAAHDAEDLVQLALVYEAMLAVDIIYDLLLNYTSLTSDELPKTDWDAATASLSDLFTGRISEPTPVIDLIGELAVQAGISIWPDPATGLIQMKALTAQASTVTVDDDGWIKADSFSRNIEREKRLSQVWVYYGQKVPTERLDDAKNFHSRLVTPDLDAQTVDQYGSAAIRTIYSRWIPQFGRQAAINVSERLLAMFRDPPMMVEFEIPLEKASQLAIGDVFDLSVAEVVDQYGAPLTKAVIPVEIAVGEDTCRVRAQTVAFAESAATGERVIYIENDVNNITLRTIHDTLYAVPLGGSPGEVVRFIVVAGVTIGSTSTSTYAIEQGTWPEGVSLILENLGRIQGKGGNGGNPAVFPSYGGGAGGAGGPAIHATYPMLIDNTSGEIWGGGGGGGAGANMYAEGTGYAVGGGGGGGAGTAIGENSSTANSQSIAYNNNIQYAGNGGDGTSSTGGSGGQRGGTYDIYSNPQYAGAGGNAGGPGLSGSAGGSTVHGSGGGGGAAGYYLVGTSYITWAGTGDVRGSVS